MLYCGSLNLNLRILIVINRMFVNYGFVAKLLTVYIGHYLGGMIRRRLICVGWDILGSRRLTLIFRQEVSSVEAINAFYLMPTKLAFYLITLVGGE